MNYYPNTWRGATRGAGSAETRGLMQPHRLKAGPWQIFGRGSRRTWFSCHYYANAFFTHWT